MSGKVCSIFKGFRPKKKLTVWPSSSDFSWAKITLLTFFSLFMTDKNSSLFLCAFPISIDVHITMLAGHVVRSEGHTHTNTGSFLAHDSSVTVRACKRFTKKGKGSCSAKIMSTMRRVFFRENAAILTYKNDRKKTVLQSGGSRPIDTLWICKCASTPLFCNHISSRPLQAPLFPVFFCWLLLSTTTLDRRFVKHSLRWFSFFLELPINLLWRWKLEIPLLKML